MPPALGLSTDISPRAREIHFRSLVVDTHTDTTQRLIFDDFDLGERHADGSVDIPRLREGGVGAIFFAVWIRSAITGKLAVDRALAQIDAIRGAVHRHRNRPPDAGRSRA